MKPKSLSASALHVYEGCPCRYRHEYVDRAPTLSGSAADLGTVCHSALEQYVANGHYKTPSLEKLLEFYALEYPRLFTDRGRYDEGAGLLTDWWNRTDLLDGRTILSCEIKETFPLKTSAGEIPVTYIWDRCDELPDGSIEVVDYKTVAVPIQPEELKQRIQPRLYALAAAIKYPGRPKYWVSYDLLRHDVVGAVFTREENLVTWNWLKDVAERILADDGTTEKLNPECRWCIRKTECQTLLSHSRAGGSLGISSLEEAADKRAKLDYARGALQVAINDLDAYILAECENQEITEYATDATELKIGGRATREIDPQRAAKILGPDIMARYGKLTMTAIDTILKNEGLDPDTRSALRQLITKKMGSITVKTKPRSTMEDE